MCLSRNTEECLIELSFCQKREKGEVAGDFANLVESNQASRVNSPTWTAQKSVHAKKGVAVDRGCFSRFV